ncbi:MULTISPECIES: type 4a pilus biogenesis protein PilO [unclassified Methylophaga]|uniref:type 4a pilus biogenesis protein PilO n=2 Tax=Methylophaga TaxID=40222 RepID=UPI000C407E60|nr:MULTISPECIES: type 4a pilus biogenesis protein PilO [unclassified Methylophaga]MAL50116.1 pilus assembly protein PilO [Methylophaga sp.]MAP27659.1 pilus assembly protein PilO [Methylophaga sp.]MBP26399.1 pilus assembly protein PilO [Methylophaga sp.]HAD30390.1 pilus assembly protein PilO [Methylophaga sp.]HBX58910.1 pilus assembly protein PilO [Methylophaga sp.]
MDIPSVNDIDFNESGEWPLIGKIVAGLLIFAVIWGAGYYFIIKDKRVELAQLEQTETELRTSFEIKQSKAVNLEAYKEQMKEMELSFASMLQQLPRKSEVADLLVDISRTGLVNGLEFELFKPEEERPIDFYIELPITMRVTGTYHQFAEFISGIAALPRIVTLHNFKMGPLTSDGNMTMDITAKTYRYFDEQGN